MSIHVIRLANGKPSYRVKLRTSAGQQYSQTFRTKREAEAFEGDQRAALRAGTAIDPWAGNILLSDYADSWMTQRVALRPKTVDLYRYLLRLHILPDLGMLELKAITTARIRSWHASVCAKNAVGPSTRAKAYRLLRAMLTTAVDDELLARNPCRIKGAGNEYHDERPTASPRQITALAEATGPRYRVMVLIAAWCGLRYGELAGLTRADIDLDSRTVRVRQQLQERSDGSLSLARPKTAASNRTVSLPPHLLPDLLTHLAEYVGSESEAPVFTGPDGHWLRRSNFNRRVWQPACTAANVSGFRFHDLRHTGNTLAAGTGASTRELMARMGHSSPRAALIYQHATPDRDRTLADALSAIALEQTRSASFGPPAESAAAAYESYDESHVKAAESPLSQNDQTGDS